MGRGKPRRKKNMYKNKTLKSLAISAVVALGLTGLSSIPSLANYGLADKSFVTLAPSAGDEWTVLADGDFQVKIGKAANLTTGVLKLLVEDTGAKVSSPTTSDVVTTSPASWTSQTVSNGVNRKSSTDGTYVMAMSSSNAISGNITISALASNPFSDSSTVKVTAWNDANLNNLIDSNEYASPTETVTFLDGDDVKLVVTLSRPKVGETFLGAVVSTTPTLNNEQGAVLDKNTSALGFDVVFNRDGFASTISYGSGVWDEEDRNYTFTSSALSSVWSTEKADRTSLNGASTNSSISIAVAGTATFTTSNSHKVSVGDSMTYSTSAITGTATVSKIVSATKFEATVPTSSGTVSAAVAALTSYVSVYDAVTSGTYGVTGKWKDVFGTKSEFATVAPVSADVKIDVVGSSSVQGLASYTGEASGTGGTVLVKSGTTTLTVKATVVDKDGAAVAAGRVVTVANASRTTDVRVNGKTGTDTLLTDASGQVTVTVTSTAGASTAGVDLTFTPENVSAATSGIRLDWAAQTFSLRDMSVANSNIATSRSIVAKGSYTVDLVVADQWFAAPAATDTYRVVVTGTGATNAIIPVTAGKAAVTIGDNGISTTYTTVLTLEKLGTSGTYAAVSGGAVTIDTFVKTGVVTMGADATSLYNGVTVDLSSPVAAAALVEADNRVSVVAIPDYKNKAVIAGKVASSANGAAVPGAYVTVTGPTTMLFNVGNVWKRGSITVIANASGEFSADVYSTTAQTDTVVTASSMGNSATSKLTFTGIGVGEGTSLVITAPAAVAPASTLQIKAQLNDTYGNGVEATAGRIKFTYEGPGIGFGTVPDKTDKTGGLTYSVLLGAGDKGTIKVTVQYDQNGDGDFVDTKDLTKTASITVGAVAPSVEQKLTVGSFKGYLAIYAKGYAGKKLSAKVAGKWLSVASLSDFQRVIRNTGAGYTVKVDLYIDGSLVKSETITTK